MTNNVYQVLDDIKAFLDTGAFTNTVSFGDISDVDLDKQTVFPLAHINISDATITEQTIEFNMNVMAMDIVDDNSLDDFNDDLFLGNDNLQSILNTQLSVMNRLHTELTRGHLRDGLLATDEDLVCEPFKDRFANVLAGWTATIRLVVPNTSSRTNPDGSAAC